MKGQRNYLDIHVITISNAFVYCKYKYTHRTQNSPFNMIGIINIANMGENAQLEMQFYANN